MKMHWCSCKVNLAGQGHYVYDFLPTNPVSWPEVQVLSLLHGEENVYDVKPVAVADVSPTDEKRRLISKYGPVCERVFPGRTFRMEMAMPAEATEGLKQLDGDGIAVATMPPEPQPGDEDGPPAEMPSTNAVFKPGRHQRPNAPGA